MDCCCWVAGGDCEFSYFDVEGVTEKLTIDTFRPWRGVRFHFRNMSYQAMEGRRMGIQVEIGCRAMDRRGCWLISGSFCLCIMGFITLRL